MQVGLDSYSYRYAAGLWGWKPEAALDPPAYLRRAEELGLAGVQFADLGHFPSLDEGSLVPLRRQADDAGLYLELGTGGSDPGHLEMALHAAATLGSPVLRTFVGGFRWQGGLTGHALVERATHDLRRIAPAAERLGVRVALENHLDLLTEELIALLAAVGSDHVGVCLDTGNPFGLLEDPLAVAEALAPHTFTTHLKEFRVTLRRDGLVLRGTALGRGDVPNPEIVALLRERSPLGGALHLNVETAIERVTVPVFEPQFAATLASLSASDVLRTLARVDLDRPWTEEQLALPEERALTPDETLAEEHTQIAESAAWALARFA
jgi:3-oxoisoapionate decarboxylase